MYRLMILLSLVAGLIISTLILRKKQVPLQLIVLSLLLVSVLGLQFSLGMTLILYKGQEFGFNGTGGALGLILGVMIFSFITPAYGRAYQTAYLTALPLMYGISKIGCSYAGCCYGFAYAGPFAVIYSDGISRLPNQLIEVTVFLLLFVVEIRLAVTDRFRPVPAAVTFLILKLLLDFLRDTHLEHLISANQIISLLAIFIVLFMPNPKGPFIKRE